jgi:hypothetical protein
MARHGPAQPPAEPPPGIAWALPRLPVPVGTRLLRLNGAAFPDPAYFGTNALHRFDAPDRSFGVCYLGTTLECCFLEVLAQTRIAVAQPWLVAAADLRAFYTAIVTVERQLDLVYLADAGLATLGIDQRHTGGDDYGLSQRWSAAIHAHGSDVDGIFYTSRHHNRMYAVALFERARGKVRFDTWGPLGDRGVVDLWVETERILRTYAIIVI